MKHNAPHYLILILVATLIGCAPLAAPSATVPNVESTATPQSEAPPAETAGGKLAVVDTLEIRILESDPVQVEVVARGNLADGCTKIVDPTVTLDGNEFQIVLTTERPADAMCTQALVPFEQIIPLDVANAAPGEYTVDLNGVTYTFDLGS